LAGAKNKVQQIKKLVQFKFINRKNRSRKNRWVLNYSSCLFHLAGAKNKGQQEKKLGIIKLKYKKLVGAESMLSLPSLGW